jgi:hypothetical protein
MMQRDRYRISVSYNEVSKCDMFHVLVDNGVVLSTHGTRHEAAAAIKRYIVGDKRRDRQPDITERKS